jgi:hypothetical protein
MKHALQNNCFQFCSGSGFDTLPKPYLSSVCVRLYDGGTIKHNRIRTACFSTALMRFWRPLFMNVVGKNTPGLKAGSDILRICGTIDHQLIASECALRHILFFYHFA